MRVLLVSTTNVAVNNATSSTRKITGDQIKISRMASHAADVAATPEEQEVMVQYQAKNYDKWLTNKPASKTLISTVATIHNNRDIIRESPDPKEIVDCMAVNAELLHEAMKEFMTLYSPQVIGMTIALLLRFRSFDILKDVTHIVVDEAS